jgi:cobalamin synthase
MAWLAGISGTLILGALMVRRKPALAQTLLLLSACAGFVIGLAHPYGPVSIACGVVPFVAAGLFAAGVGRSTRKQVGGMNPDPRGD